MHNINSAMKEVVSSILEISQKTSNAVEISNDTLENSETTKAVIQKLDKDSQEINEITKIVTSIANQTNILALNASIEAMRAGEAGRSFTVVATEVKNLAKQTKQLASKISDKLSRLQEQLNIALDSITNTTSSVKTINDNSEQIAWSINVQEELNQEIFQSVGNADKQLSLLSENIAKMKENMANTANNQL